MGYLSQKKKYTNIKELLNISLLLLFFCSVIILFFSDTKLSSSISHFLFQIYIYTLIITTYAIFNRFYMQSLGLFLISFILFLNIGMGGNLFFDVKTDGAQSINILYHTDTKNLHDINQQIVDNQVDFAGINRGDKPYYAGSFSDDLFLSSYPMRDSLVITPRKVTRTGDVLLSKSNRAAFTEAIVNNSKIIFITTDFSTSSTSEKQNALKNLGEFINMQDAPVIVVGDFGVEAWSSEFLVFMEKTGLEVKNSIMMSNGETLFNPFVVPTVNILAYKNFGINKISFLRKKHNSRYPLLLKINY